MMKWIIIILAIIIGGTVYVLKNGGGLEMQEEHKVETPTKVEPKVEAPKAPAAEPAKAPVTEPKK
jgi:hypothetical protein